MAKCVLSVLFLLITALIFVQCQEQDRENVQHSFAGLANNFESPPKEYSSGPLWVWNDLVTREKIDFQLQEFKKENILQVFIHPRPGLITEYLSDEWFELCRYTLDQAQELGMNVWMYDENSYPSGFAGGHVMAQMPEANQGNKIAMRIGNEIIPALLDQYIIVLKREGDSFQQIEEVPAELNEKYYAFEILYEKPEGWQGGSTYVDLLIPGVTEKFIEVTMKGYEASMGHEFGKSVPGIFTDEPNIAPDGPGVGVKYSPVLFDEFEKRWGYDLKENLPALFEDLGDFKKVRYHYYRILLELFIDRWSKPWYEYTESKNLKWTGHYWEHGWPSPHHGGDNMAMFAWHQMPGIDMLFNNFEDFPGQFGNVRAVKEASSIANQLGRERVLCETYGGAGWELTFNDMKRLGEWQSTMGVNFLNQHLSYMTLKGRRKGDFPQSFLTHSPYWEDFGVLSQNFARLSFALSMGKQINSTLILEPTTTAWMYYAPPEQSPKLDSLEQSFRYLVDQMEKLQLEYDLGSENVIKDHGQIDEELFTIGKRSYDVVILPPYFENIDASTFELLKQYVENGGLVFSFSIPDYINGEKSTTPGELAATSNNWITIEGIDDTDVLDALKSEDFIAENPTSIKGKVFHQRRYFNDGQLIFWSNFNEQGNEQVTFSITGKSVSLLDPLTGEITSFPATIQDSLAKVSFKLAPSGSKLFFVHNEVTDQGDVPPTEEDKSWEISTTEESTVYATESNSLSIDFVDLKVGKKTFHDLYFATAADSAYKLNGLSLYSSSSHDPWAVAVQYKTNVLDMAKQFDANSGFEATYAFTVEEGFNTEKLEAVVEWADLYEVSCNGTIIQPVEGKHWLDPSFDVFEITDLVRAGRNELKIRLNPMHIHAEIEPVYLVGDFSLVAVSKGFNLVTQNPIGIGSWKEQGMPFYTQSVVYEKQIEVNEGTDYKIQLNEWRGTVARVLINKEQVGIIGWPPYEFDLTPHLSPGNQKIAIEVVGSLKNLLGPHHGNIRKGFVTPWTWLRGPKAMPPGDAYHQLDYGLLEDFCVLVSGKGPAQVATN